MGNPNRCDQITAYECVNPKDTKKCTYQNRMSSKKDYQYKLCVCERWKWDVLELRGERSRTLGMGWNLPEQVRLQALSGRNRGAAAEAHAIGELQVKPEQQLNLRWTQLRSNSRSERNRGAVETDAIGE